MQAAAPPSTRTTKSTGFSAATVAIVVLLVSAVVVTILLLVFLQFRSVTLQTDATDRQNAHAKDIANNLGTYLISAQQLANTTAALVAPIRGDRAQVESLLLKVLSSAPKELIYGVGVWYEPNVFSPSDALFGPYVHQPKTAASDPLVLTTEWMTTTYNFPTQPWYLAGKNGGGKPVFTEPYFDTDLIYMTTSKAFYDGSGQFSGVVTVDMVLPQLRSLIAQANISPQESIYVLTAQGALFVHPQEAALLTFAQQHGAKPGSILDLSQKDLDAYNQSLNLPPHTEATVPVSAIGWTVHIATDNNFLFADVVSLRTNILLLMVVLWLAVLGALPILRRAARQTNQQQQARLKLEAEVLDRKHTEDMLQAVNLSLEQKVAERTAELQKAKEEAENANQVKSTFLANMSHELRTPLNAILNFTAFIAEGFMGPVNEEQVDSLRKVIDSATHLLSLINDVLDITKIEVGMMDLFIEEVDVNAALKSVLSVGKGLIKDKPVDLITKIEEPLPKISGDRRRIQQVFLNLISNAVKFTPKGSVTVTERADYEAIHLDVRDTGVGIATENQHLVFESFRQISNTLIEAPGTGLGMPISKHFVEAHGGRIWFDSQVGVGTTFHVVLPIRGLNSAAA